MIIITLNRLIKYCFILSLLFAIGANSGAAKTIILSKCNHVKALGIGSIDGGTKDQIHKNDDVQLSSANAGRHSLPLIETEEESKEEWLLSISQKEYGSRDNLNSSNLSLRHNALNHIWLKYNNYSCKSLFRRYALLSVYII